MATAKKKTKKVVTKPKQVTTVGSGIKLKTKNVKVRIPDKKECKNDAAVLGSVGGSKAQGKAPKWNKSDASAAATALNVCRHHGKGKKKSKK
jgi:hypothetical protein